ncbi:MAG: 16S rRNA (cytosine(1402)-N(4))-methyltransferase RsmH [Gammaproteobacteria bacterium]|nr:16S rRNA (cytosine(1402)-N(4))-methyltransferase RsmH [Gammaproteobacteria bacterium]
MDIEKHEPVMAAEVVEALAISEQGMYWDATFGRGGHSRGILARLGAKGGLVVVDRDPQAVAAARSKYGGDSRVTIIKGPFSMLGQQIKQAGLEGRLQGIVFDLGVSSPQLEDPARGFAFSHEGPLDMRMDPESGISARDWLNTVEEKELGDVIRRYGEERHARHIARTLIAARGESPIETTAQLTAILLKALPGYERHKHPATRTFQAIRIHINRELREIEDSLPQAVQGLAPGGRLVVISFHSLEDRIVKRFFRKAAKGDEYPLDLPITHDALRPQLKLLGRAQRPSKAEVAANPRARSAVMRVAQRTEVICA